MVFASFNSDLGVLIHILFLFCQNYVITTFRGKERGDFILKSTSKVFEVTPKLTYTFRIRLDVDGSKLSEPLKVTIRKLELRDT